MIAFSYLVGTRAIVERDGNGRVGSSASAFRQDHCSLEQCDLIFMGPVILNTYFKTGLKDPGFYHAQSWK